MKARATPAPCQRARAQVPPLHPDTFRREVVHFTAESMTESLNNLSIRERLNVLVSLTASWRLAYPAEDREPAWKDFLDALAFVEGHAAQ